MVSPTSRIRVERVDDSLAIVMIEGEHDLSTAPELRGHLSTLLSDGTSAVVDLSAATFVDSSVLAALIEASQQGSEQGLGFSVALPAETDEAVRRVIEVTGLGDAIELCETRESAVEAARSEEGE